MASLQLVFLVLGTVCIHVQALNSQSTCNTTILAIVRELKAELSRDHSMAVSELKKMLRKQEERSEDLAYDMRALRKSLSYRLENSERKIEWAITDGSLPPKNTSWVMENFRLVKKRLDDMEASHKTLGALISYIKPKDCAVLYKKGVRSNGVYTIYPYGGAGMRVYCDMWTDGGGWTVFQKRDDGKTDFFKGWEAYAQGFGDPEGDYWLGLRHIHMFTEAEPTELYVGVIDLDLGLKYAKYGSFKVASEADKFRINIGSYSGTAGNGLAWHNGQKFSTKDQDNDPHPDNCSNKFHGAWWFNGCLHSDLNGRFSTTKHTGNPSYIVWFQIRNSWVSMKGSFMMLRPADMYAGS